MAGHYGRRYRRVPLRTMYSDANTRRRPLLELPCRPLLLHQPLWRSMMFETHVTIKVHHTGIDESMLLEKAQELAVELHVQE